MNRAARRAAASSPPTLEEAHRALEGGSPTQALEALLRCWRKTPDPRVADRIVALAVVAQDELGEELGAATGTAQQRRQQLWRLAKRPADPRIDRFVAELYARPPFTSTSARPFWTDLLPLAFAVRDSTALETMKQVRARWTDETAWERHLSGHLDRVLEKVKLPAAVPLTEAEHEALEGIDTRLPQRAATPSIDGLLEAVLAHVDDEGARLVLMDALLEAGHPRGELMALQAKGELTATERKRERALIAEQREPLLGPLAAALKPRVVFRRGFLSEGDLNQGSANSVRLAVQQTVGCPLWATVERLSGAPAALSGHEVMRSLRALSDSEVPARPVPRLTELVNVPLLLEDDARRLIAPGAFPALTTLHMFGQDDLMEQVVTGLVAPLRSLGVRTGPLLAGTPHERWLSLALQTPATEVVISAYVYDARQWGTVFRFVREGTRRTLEIAPSREHGRANGRYLDSHHVLERLGDRLDGLALRVPTETADDASLLQLIRAVEARGGQVLPVG